MNRFEFLKKIRFPKLGRPSIRQWIFLGVTVALSVAAFIFVSNFTACWALTDLPGIPPAGCEGGLGALTRFNPEGTPIALEDLPPTPIVAPESALPPAWDGASRINILFIGLDARDWAENQGPPRSDTMILFTIDPLTKTAGMLSIPRDLWVNIPGFGYSRINTAYSSGEGAQLPGGGPGLAMKTVEQLLGVPVHYYAQIDFLTFIDMVNVLGCIRVVPEERLVLDPIGSGLDHVVITPGGERELCGWKVLAYARTRKTEGGDSDRSKRQQQVIFALQKKIFDPEVFPSLIAQAPTLYKQLSNGIHTNMPLEDAIRLAVLGKDISRESIKTGVIDTSMVTFDNVILGGENASIMKPIADKIRVLRDEIFTSSGPLSPLAQGDPAALMRDEEARVRIMDGTFTPGLDQRAGAFFQSYGMNVTEVGPAPEAHGSTVIILYGPKLYTLRWMQGVFGISNRQIKFSPDPSSSVDIEIRIGSDIAGSIPQ
ncbi:MAG: LCP family protein [Anaerolineales bacterium]|nr:LCP family protein [Anaerolineales bacterium]